MIDEKKLIEKINDYCSEFDESLEENKSFDGYNIKSICMSVIAEILDLIQDQPKVGEWILVEERLPNEEEFEKYYCRNHYAAEFIVMIKGANRPTSLYYKEGVWFDDDNNDYDVLAWMPLPEYPRPYSSGD